MVCWSPTQKPQALVGCGRTHTLETILRNIWDGIVTSAPLDQALAGLLTGAAAEAGFCERCRADKMECKRA